MSLANTPKRSSQPAAISLLHSPLIEVIGIGLLFLAGFFNLVNLNVEKDTVKLDGQVLVKLLILAGCGLYGVWGVITNSRVRKILSSFPMLWIVIIIGCYFVSSFGSITRMESLASTISMVCVTAMTVTALVQLGVARVITTLFYALSLFISLSWLAYFVWPELGQFAEPLADGQFQNRMSGLAHPNTLGQFSGLTIILGLILYKRFQRRSLLAIAIMLMAAAALAFSLSRTSMVATACAGLFVFRSEIFRREHVNYAVGILMIVSVGVLFLSTQDKFSNKLEQKLSFLSKSGDTSELTSATGRVDIWAFAARKIADRPLIGYGAATSKYYLTDYSNYTHNMIMNIAFSTGIIGGLAALFMCLGRLIALFKYRHALADPIIAFILINGLFENVIFSFLAGLPTILWIMGLCLPHPDLTPLTLSNDDAP